VNTFLSSKGSPTIVPAEVIRATTEEKEFQINTVKNLQARFETESKDHLKKLQKVAVDHGNLFEELMDAAKFCSLGQITDALFNVGGQYRRNM